MRDEIDVTVLVLCALIGVSCFAVGFMAGYAVGRQSR